MPLTLREVLDLDVVRRGQPQVMAAADRLDAGVRWVHASEVADVGRLLHGGELLLASALGRGTTVTVVFPVSRVVPEVGGAPGQQAARDWAIEAG